MKGVVRLLLASGAGLATATAANAADLPVKAKPIEYVKICSLYGAGFYYIPGTDTCIRIGGHIRSEISFGNGRGTATQSWTATDGNATNTRDRDQFYTRTRVFLQTDVRTQTDFGTLRAFSLIRYEISTPVGLTSAAGTIFNDAAIIQWGGFTIGKLGTSFIDNPWNYAFKYSAYTFGTPDTASGPFAVAYTHQFGNGVTASVSLEDGKFRKRGNYNGATPLSAWGNPAVGTDTRGGNTWPEIVGQFRIEQAWGGFHLAGHLVNNHIAYACGASGATCTEITGPTPADKIGGGVTAAMKLNVPTGVNDALYISGSYSLGNTQDAFNSTLVQPAGFGIFGSSNLNYGSIVGGYQFDSVYSTAGGAGAGKVFGPTGQQLTKTYGGLLAFEHGWDAAWRTSVFGGVQVIDYNETANAILCSRQGPGSAAGTLSNAGTTCNMDYRIYGVGTRTYWSGIRDFQIGVEMIWTNHHSGNKGATYTLPATLGYKPAVAYEVKDQNVFSGMLAVRRFF
ncbi:hypothetical protein X566_05045 [Afipia sp. P52-10]|uniref:porin n=1 Tax=Afipia sp. P52-10 TaxID=1429916 RepID=UPI0003DF04B0|nr:porin [Afipia sp. P52-10]ETR78980.1 hypothetical protein X566_05045 [Afipia sp. P52-10]